MAHANEKMEIHVPHERPRAARDFLAPLAGNPALAPPAAMRRSFEWDGQEQRGTRDGHDGMCQPTGTKP